MAELWIGIVIGSFLTLIYTKIVGGNAEDYDSDQWTSWEEDVHGKDEGLFFTTSYIRLKRVNKETGDVQFKKVVKSKEL